MGIMVNAFSIILGTVLGDIFKNRIAFKNFSVLGISIMIISLAGFLENIFSVTNASLTSNELLPVVFALIIGTLIGDSLHIEEKISGFSQVENKSFSGFLDTALFFGVGGLQICGAILLATSGNSSQLILKSAIDFPFAILFGISYGKHVAVSAIPVAVGQLFIVLLAKAASSFLTNVVIGQICAIGYIILFFSGFNIICEKNHKINNVNMIPGILMVILYNLFIKLWELI